MGAVAYRLNPEIAYAELDSLHAAAWPNHVPLRDFGSELERSLVYVAAYADQRLIGFVRVAWDGGIHGFLLDPTVHPDYRRRGIGQRLVETAIAAARERRIRWIHVDFPPDLRPFYAACGFAPTEAGLVDLFRTD